MPETLRFDDDPDPGRPEAGRPDPGDSGSGSARVIVKVRKPGYVPEGFQVRSRIDDIIFTAEASEAALAAAEDDPEVESVERGRPLHPL